MSINFFEYLKEIFEDIDTLNREKVRGLYRETHAFFASLGEMIQFGNQESKEKAFTLLSEIKQFLDAKAEQVASSPSSSLSDEDTSILLEMETSLDSGKEGKLKKIKKLKPKNMS